MTYSIMGAVCLIWPLVGVFQMLIDLSLGRNILLQCCFLST